MSGSFDDSGCTGGQWVSAAFSSPVQATAGVEYVVALDSVTHYVKTDGALSEVRKLARAAAAYQVEMPLASMSCS